MAKAADIAMFNPATVRDASTWADSGAYSEHVLFVIVNSPSNARTNFRVEIERWPLRAPFRITGHVFTEQSVVVVTLRCDGLTGRGEASGVYYRDDVPEKMLAQLDAIRPEVEAGLDRHALQRLLPAGGARAGETR